MSHRNAPCLPEMWLLIVIVVQLWWLQRKWRVPSPGATLLCVLEKEVLLDCASVSLSIKQDVPHCRILGARAAAGMIPAPYGQLELLLSSPPPGSAAFLALHRIILEVVKETLMLHYRRPPLLRGRWGLVRPEFFTFRLIPPLCWWWQLPLRSDGSPKVTVTSPHQAPWLSRAGWTQAQSRNMIWLEWDLAPPVTDSPHRAESSRYRSKEMPLEVTDHESFLHSFSLALLSFLKIEDSNRLL